MSAHRTVATLCAALLAAAQLLSAQNAAQARPPAPASGIILGRVVDAVSNTPVSGAVVQLVREMPDGELRLGVATGTDGQFMFAALPAGPYSLRARKSGYASGGLGQMRVSPHEDGGFFELGANERRGDVTLRLWKYSAITGRVVDESGDPIVGVRVNAFRRSFLAGRPVFDAHAQPAETDDRGIYRLSRLVPGDYVVGVVRGDRSVPASVVDDLARLERAGDKAGLEELRRDLRQHGAWVDPPGSSQSLRLGDSYVSVDGPPPVIRDGSVFLIPTTFYPGTSRIADARAITVGQTETSGIDLTLRPVRAVSVSGTITDGGKAVANFPVRLNLDGSEHVSGEWSSPAMKTITDARGRYTFPAVPPGQYTLAAFRGQPAWFEGMAIMIGEEGGGVVMSKADDVPALPEPIPTRFGSAGISVGDRTVEVSPIHLSEGVKASGRLTFSGAAKPPSPERLDKLYVVFEQADGHVRGMEYETVGKVDRDGRFESVALPPGKYLLRTHDIEGWTLASALVGGRDASVTPVDIGETPVSGVEIRFTDRPAAISGSVASDARSADAPGRLVVLFPSDRAGWVDFGLTPRRLLERVPDQTGTFEFSGIPAGEYLLAAFVSDGLRDWREPESLERLSRQATSVKVGEGDRRTISISVSVIR